MLSLPVKEEGAGEAARYVEQHDREREPREGGVEMNAGVNCDQQRGERAADLVETKQGRRPSDGDQLALAQRVGEKRRDDRDQAYGAEMTVDPAELKSVQAEIRPDGSRDQRDEAEKKGENVSSEEGQSRRSFLGACARR